MMATTTISSSASCPVADGAAPGLVCAGCSLGHHLSPGNAAAAYRVVDAHALDAAAAADDAVADEDGVAGRLMSGLMEPMVRLSLPMRSVSLNCRSLLASKNRLLSAAPIGSMALSHPVPPGTHTSLLGVRHAGRRRHRAKELVLADHAFAQAPEVGDTRSTYQPFLPDMSPAVGSENAVGRCR